MCPAETPLAPRVGAVSTLRVTVRRVLLTGASGFVGGRLHPELVRARFEVRRASRHPRSDGDWVRLDLDDPSTLPAALRDIDTVVYLVHGMADGGDYAQREHRAAAALAQAAAAAGVQHIVYLGGVAPQGEVSQHLKSRLDTGSELRAGRVPVTELRAGVILGEGSASWQIIRDLSVRLPAMILPAWLRYRMEPISIRDVVAALLHAVERGPAGAGVFDLPGPEKITGEDLLARVSAAAGLKPFTVRVPLVTPRLSGYWLRFVSDVDRAVADELVEGFTSDLVAREGGSFWAVWSQHARVPLDQAIEESLRETEAARSLRSLLGEWVIRRVGRNP